MLCAELVGNKGGLNWIEPNDRYLFRHHNSRFSITTVRRYSPGCEELGPNTLQSKHCSFLRLIFSCLCFSTPLPKFYLRVSLYGMYNVLCLTLIS